MSRNKQRHYLVHILEAIERVGRYTEDMSESAFLENEMVQDAVIRNVEIIGEASHNIEEHYPEFATNNPQLPLARVPNAQRRGARVPSRLIWKSSGRRSNATFRGFTGRSERFITIFRTRKTVEG
jgi:uncharacterized protein with HEPN domain